MVGSLLIFAREGLEGTLICSILLTYLASAGRRDLFRYVFLGAGAAVVLATAAGIAALDRESGDAFIGSASQAVVRDRRLRRRGVRAHLHDLLDAASQPQHGTRAAREGLRRGAAVAPGIALGLIAFVTVGREAVETVIFLLAITYQSSPLQVVIGAVIGLAIALSASYAMYPRGPASQPRAFLCDRRQPADGGRRRASSPTQSRTCRSSTCFPAPRRPSGT